MVYIDSWWSCAAYVLANNLIFCSQNRIATVLHTILTRSISHQTAYSLYFTVVYIVILSIFVANIQSICFVYVLLYSSFNKINRVKNLPYYKVTSCHLDTVTVLVWLIWVVHTEIALTIIRLRTGTQTAQTIKTNVKLKYCFTIPT